VPDTGFPAQDAQSDFSRARRRQTLSRLARRLRREPDDVNVILPFDEVTQALGWRGERRLGLRVIPLDSIVGSVDRSRDFDRRFRPTSRRVRRRWEGIAAAIRRGEAMPPIDAYRVGDMHFVRDGHHRVSVAQAMGVDTIEAYVTEVLTAVGADQRTRIRDLALKGHERLFFERVPLPPESRERIRLTDEWRYAELAESVEAWGFRAMQEAGVLMPRGAVAESWFQDEYVPVVAMLRESGLIGSGTEAEAYMRVAGLRYLLLRTHEWSDDVVERLRESLRRPGDEEDTMVHRLRRELRRGGLRLRR
jgi:hypothetical protein